MNLTERVSSLVAALPSDSSAVTLTRADLRAWLAETPALPEDVRDLSVEDVAERVGRAPSTVRGWCQAGALRGYKLNGRDWRVTRDALKAFLADQAAPREPEPDPGAPIDISAWRKLR